MSHYTIATLPQKYFDIENIPRHDPSGLVGEDRLRYDRLRKGIEHYLATRDLTPAASEANCSPPELLRQFYRFAKRVASDEIVGWRALARYERLEPYTLQRSEHRRAGSGLFTDLLRKHEGIEAGLIEAIQSRIGKYGVKLSRKSKREVYGTFKRLCAGISRDAYPWTFDSAARASVYRYIDSYLPGHTEDFDIWFGFGAKGRLAIGGGTPGFSLATQPFDLVQIDAHKIDVIGTIKVMTEHGPRVIPIKRLWIVVLQDLMSGAVLGYSVSFEDQISGDTIERAIISSQTPWSKRELSKGLYYEPRSALPAGHIKGLASCPIANIRMDNFSSHYAELVQTVVRKSLGCHVTFGGIGKWWTNAKLERLFGVLEQRGIHPLTSSMGTGPTDPLRPLDPVGNAIAEALDWRFIVDLVEVLVTEHNALRGSGRSDMSSLEIINNHIQDAEIGFLPRMPVPSHPSAPRLGWEVKRRRIAGSMKAGNIRRPYIEILGRHYSNPRLGSSFELIGHYAYVHTRKDDMYVEAFAPDGSALGELLSNGEQNRHTVSMQDLRLARKGRNREDVPEYLAVEEHSEELRRVATQDALKRPRNVSTAATELAERANRRRSSVNDAGADADAEHLSVIDNSTHQDSKSRSPSQARPSALVPKFGRLRRV
jgi:putative transposase